jgi:hypothetical protein
LEPAVNLSEEFEAKKDLQTLLTVLFHRSKSALSLLPWRMTFEIAFILTDRFRSEIAFFATSYLQLLHSTKMQREVIWVSNRNAFRGSAFDRLDCGRADHIRRRANYYSAAVGRLGSAGFPDKKVA